MPIKNCMGVCTGKCRERNTLRRVGGRRGFLTAATVMVARDLEQEMEAASEETSI
jgi:excinuclease UvrABC nuclease subunit